MYVLLRQSNEQKMSWWFKTSNYNTMVALWLSFNCHVVVNYSFCVKCNCRGFLDYYRSEFVKVLWYKVWLCYKNIPSFNFNFRRVNVDYFGLRLVNIFFKYLSHFSHVSDRAWSHFRSSKILTVVQQGSLITSVRIWGTVNVSRLGFLSLTCDDNLIK